jgi:hypothetical protein
MSVIPSFFPCFRRFSRYFLALTVTLAASLVSGCGSGGPAQPALSGNTAVTLLATSTANDQLSGFFVSFKSLTLTSGSGKTVSLLTANQAVEFIHLNGNFESILTVSVPQDIYTSVSAEIQSAGFGCVGLVPSGGIETNAANPYGDLSIPHLTFSVPVPITITGTAMGIALNLQVPKVGTNPNSCYSSDTTEPSITATVNLNPVTFSAAGANSISETGLEGEISSVDLQNSSVAIILADGQTLSLAANNNTVYQGISGFSVLVPGTMANLDAVIRPDGSLQATRIAVEDTATTNLSMVSGPVMSVSNAIPVLDEVGQQQGYFSGIGGGTYYSFSNATFQIAGPTNVQDLPFPATFNATTMFAGQNVYVTTNATQIMPEPTYVAATSVTLVPQTINGLVTGVSNEGNFATYTVSLAPYNLIPDLAVQPGQTSVLTNPTTAVIYVDSNTRMLNSQPLASGSTLRFNGLLFNDNGTLRMGCAQVNDGVPQ